MFMCVCVEGTIWLTRFFFILYFFYACHFVRVTRPYYSGDRSKERERETKGVETNQFGLVYPAAAA